MSGSLNLLKRIVSKCVILDGIIYRFYVIFLRFYAPRFILSSSAQTTTIIIIIVLIMIGVIMNNYLTITIELLFNIT